MASKECGACGITKSLPNFHIARRNKDGRMSTCKPCRAKYAAGYYKDNVEAFAERQRKVDPDRRRDTRLQKTYGITSAQYEELFKAQGGVCAICSRPPAKMPLNVDHDHKSGLVRGLLCWHCNHRLLGSARDDSSLLRRAADYLDKPPSVGVLGEIIAPKTKRRRRTKKKGD